MLVARFLLASLPLAAQTQIGAGQVLGGIPVPSQSAEARWCPGPVLTQEGNDLVIGVNWSPATPCLVHFNLTPPQSVDPIHVAQLTSPVRVKLNYTGAAAMDELYIWAAAKNNTRPDKVMMSALQPQNFTCLNPDCTVEQASNFGTRMFPAFAVPIGFAAADASAGWKAISCIICTHQIYIGSDVGMNVRPDGAGMWFELNTATLNAAHQMQQVTTTATRLAKSAVELETSRTRARTAVNNQIAEEPSLIQMEKLLVRLKELENELTMAQHAAQRVDNFESRLAQIEATAYDSTLATIERSIEENRPKLMGVVEGTCLSGNFYPVKNGLPYV